MTEIVLIASILILICAAILWGAHSYDDGILGRAGLGVMAFSQLVIVAGAFVGNVEYTFLPEIAVTHIGMALFLCFHVRKHLRIWTKERRHVAAPEMRKCQSG